MIGIGFVGVGDISGIYLKNIMGLFKEIEVVGICDLVRAKAEKAAEKYGITKIYDDMFELFADERVDIVLNITRPYEHYGVTKAALLAGKHVYSEKPLAATFEQGLELTKLASEKGLLLGGAPDTFLGAGHQTCRNLIDSGAIGTPTGAAASMVCPGHESWHPDPEFYYKHGGGPMLDMGPYYITALINMLGAVESVTAMTRVTFPQRTITSKPLNGTVIDVDVPTTICGVMRFASGVIGTITTTFDMTPVRNAQLEVYGYGASLRCPDPNGFGEEGQITLYKRGSEPEKIANRFEYPENSRALGLADMAKALETGRPFRADCSQTLHVLEIMSAFNESARTGKEIKLTTSFERKAPMAVPCTKGILD